MYAALAHAPATPRRLWLAALLTVLQPGLGHVYCGRVRAGLAIWAAVLLAIAGATIFWVRWLFVPDVPLLVGGLAWIALDAVLIADLARWIRREGARYRLRPVNHPLAYLGVGLGLGALPLLVGGLVIAHGWVGSVELRSYAMFPSFLPGDAVLFDRMAYIERPPRPGELVVVADETQRQHVGRVIATGGQRVRIFDGRPSVAGHPIRHAPLADLHVPRFAAPEQVRLAGLDGFLEENQAQRYPVTYRPEPVARPTLTVRLAADELYVLGDNRDAAGARRLGRVSLSRVRGKPRCIWASRDARGRSRRGRAGLQVR